MGNFLVKFTNEEKNVLSDYIDEMISFFEQENLDVINSSNGIILKKEIFVNLKLIFDDLN